MTEQAAVMASEYHAGPRMEQPHGGALRPVRDSASASALASRRWALERERARQAARAGMRKAGEQLPDIRGSSTAHVVEFLVEQHTLNAADPSAKGSAQSFKQIMELAYPKPEREVGASLPAGVAGQLNLDSGQVDKLLDLLGRLGAGQEGG